MRYIFIILALITTSGLMAQKKKSDKIKTESVGFKSSNSETSVNETIKAETVVLKEQIEGPSIQFEKEVYDFGKITQGEIVRYKFKFKNIGNKPLKLIDVKPSCGCTTTNWPKNDISPGSSNEIEISFNSAGKTGAQSKTITLYTNMENSMKILYVKGEVTNPASPNFNNK